MTHAPELHFLPKPQSMHASPPDPHAEAEVPGSQPLLEQHPSVHVAWHEPSMHVWFEQMRMSPHDLHALPSPPHLSFVVPGTHVSPSQQPAQLLGEHGSLHLPSVHFCPPAQI